MSSYTLRYFNLVARGEAAKIMLLMSGADWKQEAPEWPQEKSAQPVGKLPVLVESPADGSEPLVLTETTAIEYYLAAKNGYIYQPDNITLVARQLELRSHIVDLCDAFINWWFGTEVTKPKLRELFKTTAEYLVKHHEKVLEESDSNGDHYFGSTTTLVDVALFAYITVLRTKFAGVDAEILEILGEKNAPRINKVINAVAAEPALAAYVVETK
ncbi:hypothetical protein LPJ59_005189 [Coemansia sp. RSA 2399]|nr:hypothetical protein LPJ59_005189 [Coemansia sp. RSA 2399]KAJ1895218.1 hypothetical protein LPJ81_005007 [Coemansia sp. IMI 209127]